MQTYGIAIAWPWVDDQFEIMETLAARINESRRMVIDTETALVFLSHRYPERAERWSKALWEYQEWLETIAPDDDEETDCPTCGRPWDDD